MNGLVAYLDYSDEESDKSPTQPSSTSSSSPQVPPISSSLSSFPSFSSDIPSNATTTITVNTSVTVVIRKTIQRQSTTSSLIDNYGSDSDEEKNVETGVAIPSSHPLFESSAGGVIDIISSPRPPSNSSKNTSTLRLMRLLPPEPLGQPDREIQEKIANFLKMGKNYNTMLQGMKNFHNPYILNKIAEKYMINQTASNYPPQLYDPQEWEREDYERIARRQEHVLKEKAQQDENKFVAPAAPILTSSSSSNAPGLRRWDTGQPTNKKMKSTPAVQHALQVANQLKATLSNGAIDAAATAKKEANARAAMNAKKP